ncbi:colicin E3/pyocin S6 family cytotoxin [Enterobacteriaceae bacterium H16N7]|nr:colicin E3/pyocin S6 family cytotoxin [Dryocola clanedunensis]
MTQCQGSKACEGSVAEKYRQISAEQQKSVVECKGAQACVDKANEVGRLQADYANRANELLEKARSNGGLSPEEQNELSILQVTTIQLEADRNSAIHNALMSGDSSEAKQLAINSLAQVAGTSAAGIAAGLGKASKLPAVDSNTKIATGQAVGAFEKSLVGLPPGERVAIIKQTVPKVVAEQGMVKDNRLTQMNGGREVYKGQDGNLYALDTQHARFEVLTSKGKHLGEVDFSMQKIPNSQDKSGGHNLKVK